MYNLLMHTIQIWLSSGAEMMLFCWIHPKEGFFELLAKVQLKAFIVLTMYNPREHPAGYFSNSSGKNPESDAPQPYLGHIIILSPVTMARRGCVLLPQVRTMCLSLVLRSQVSPK